MGPQDEDDRFVSALPDGDPAQGGVEPVAGPGVIAGFSILKPVRLLTRTNFQGHPHGNVRRSESMATKRAPAIKLARRPSLKLTMADTYLRRRRRTRIPSSRANKPVEGSGTIPAA